MSVLNTPLQSAFSLSFGGSSSPKQPASRRKANRESPLRKVVCCTQERHISNKERCFGLGSALLGQMEDPCLRTCRSRTWQTIQSAHSLLNSQLPSSGQSFLLKKFILTFVEIIRLFRRWKIIIIFQFTINF